MADFFSVRLARTGDDLRSAAALLREIPRTVIPYAASTALTRVASAARQDIRAEMPRVFDRPNAWTLNSVRVRPARVDKLSATIEVKDDAPNNGTRPEDYLLPNVVGGPRKEKRFERNLRYAGILAPGRRAIIGQGAKLDAYGNLSRGEIQRILTAVRASFDPAQNRTTSRKSRKNAKNAQYFVRGLDTVRMEGGAPVRRAGFGTPGIYQRQGRKAVPVLIFTDKPPQYRKRLDFDRIAQRRADEDFAAEFERAALAILSRRRR